MITFQGSTTLCKFSMNSISNRLRVSSMKYHLYIIYDKFLQNHKLRKVSDFIHVDKYIRDSETYVSASFCKTLAHKPYPEGPEVSKPTSLSFPSTSLQDKQSILEITCGLKIMVVDG